MHFLHKIRKEYIIRSIIRMIIIKNGLNLNEDKFKINCSHILLKLEKLISKIDNSNDEYEKWNKLTSR